MAYYSDRRMNQHSVSPKHCGFLTSKKPRESSSPQIHRGTAPVAQPFAFRLPKQTRRRAVSSIGVFLGFLASAD
jgi:hypothetical protein